MVYKHHFYSLKNHHNYNHPSKASNRFFSLKDEIYDAAGLREDYGNLHYSTTVTEGLKLSLNLDTL